MKSGRGDGAGKHEPTRECSAYRELTFPRDRH